jgi:competence protein ComGD
VGRQAQEQTVEATKESGFTFLELILVLAVLSILTAIILPIGDRWIRATTEDDALQLFIASVQDMQAYSMANSVITKLEFKHSGSEYTTSELSGKVISRNVFPKGMHLTNSSTSSKVEFQANGDIIKTGTLAFRTSSGQIEIRIQFQRGRMIIHE